MAQKNTAKHRKPHKAAHTRPRHHTRRQETPQNIRSSRRGGGAPHQRTAHTPHARPYTREEKETQPGGAEAKGIKGQEPGKIGGAEKTEKKRKKRGAATERRGPGHAGPETKGKRTKVGRKKKKRGRGGQPQSAKAKGIRGRKQQKNKRNGGARKKREKSTPGAHAVGGGQKKSKTATETMRRTRTRPEGRPALPSHDQQPTSCRPDGRVRVRQRI